MSANLTDEDIKLLTEKRSTNPLEKSTEFSFAMQRAEKQDRIKNLKHKLEICLYKDESEPENAYKTLRKKVNTLKAEYKKTLDASKKHQIDREHATAYLQLQALRNEIEIFSENVYLMGNAALVKIPSGPMAAFYEKMMHFVKLYTRLYMPLTPDMEENKESCTSKKQKNDDGFAQSFKRLSFQNACSVRSSKDSTSSSAQAAVTKPSSDWSI